MFRVGCGTKHLVRVYRGSHFYPLLSSWRHDFTQWLRVRLQQLSWRLLYFDDSFYGVAVREKPRYRAVDPPSIMENMSRAILKTFFGHITNYLSHLNSLKHSTIWYMCNHLFPIIFLIRSIAYNVVFRNKSHNKIKCANQTQTKSDNNFWVVKM